MYLMSFIDRKFDFRGGVWRFKEELARLNPDAECIRITNRTGKQERFGNAGTQTTMRWEDVDKSRPMVICVAGEYEEEMYEALEHGAWYVHHDEVLFKDVKLSRKRVTAHDRVLCIRECGLRLYKNARFLPHPYTRVEPKGLRRFRAVAHARIDFSKRTHLIVEANLRSPYPCVIVGNQNRAYVHWRLQKIDPNFAFHPPYTEHGAEMARMGLLNIDLTRFPNDGGGTQYTFLEAMDAGAVPVIHEDWGPVQFAALRVSSVDDIVALLDGPDRKDEWQEMAMANFKYLRLHTHNYLKDIVCS